MEVNFLKAESMYTIKARSFPVWHFFECRSEWINVYIRLRAFFDSLQFFSCCLSIRHFCYDPSVPILCSKIVLPHLHPVAGLSSHFLPLLSLFWKVLFCLYCMVLFRYLFSFPSFASTFWFISSSCIFCSNYVTFSSLSQCLIFFF